MRTSFNTFVAVLLVATFASTASALTRTYVSGVGDDANPCTRTAPCKTWAGAISRTDAGGYITALDPAGFGAVTITKSITLDGGTNLAGVLAAGTVGITVGAGASGVVTLKNLSIEGISSATYGVRVLSVAALHIEHCVIAGFQSGGVEFNAGSSSSQLFINDLAVRRSGTAVNIVTGRAVINRLVAHANTHGVFLAGSGVVLVRDSAVTGSQMGYAAAYDSTAKLTIENSVASDNLWGVVAGSGATVRLFNVSVTGNSLNGLYNDGASFIVSMGHNTITGNGTDGVFTSTLTIR